MQPAKTRLPLQTAVLSYFHKRAAEIICKLRRNQRNSRYGLENYDDGRKETLASFPAHELLAQV